MNKNIAKFCLTLAKSNLTEAQLRDACSWIERNGAGALELAVKRIRVTSKHAVKESESPTPNNRFVQQNRSKEDIRHIRIPDTAKQVDKLLRDRTELTVSRAADLLLKALEKNQQINTSALPKLQQKKGFHNWIRRLSKKIPYNIILHEATRIRNDIVKAPTTDWPLRDSD